MKRHYLFVFFLFYLVSTTNASVNPDHLIQPFHSVFKDYKQDGDFVKVSCRLSRKECFGDGPKMPRDFVLSKEEFQKQKNWAMSVFVTHSSSDKQAKGSSVLITPNVVITNRHVFKPNKRPDADCGNFHIDLNHKNEKVYCEKVLYCSKIDLCLVQMKKMENGKNLGEELTVFKLNAEDTFEDPNKEYIVIGNPLGYGIKVSSGKNAKLNEFSYVSHGAPVLPGNSGGVFLNTQGELVGLVTAQNQGDNFNNESQSYSIPTEFIIPHMVRLKLMP